MGPDHRFLPDELQPRSVRRASAVDLAAEVIRNARLSWQAPSDGEFTGRGSQL